MKKGSKSQLPLLHCGLINYVNAGSSLDILDHSLKDAKQNSYID